MLLILNYPEGRRIEGILLAAGPHQMRIVVRGVNETIELQRTHGEWKDSQGHSVAVEACIADGSPAALEFASRLGNRVSIAGS